ncbi:hypothetical protein J3R83DRAFT_3570 [Lanmaoa asiatica]|nr:hypothetical protein J3R83DRAFT_3570 [Lanmaoa asiatica]
MNCRNNANAKHAGEILCPNDYDYELDSDCEDEDEDEASSPVELCASSPPHEPNVATLEGQQSESSTESSGSSLSSFELEGVSDQGSVDYQSEEVIKAPGESPNLFSATATDYEPAILIKFAAHRTWYAFLWYCYTGQLEFSKLKSQVESGAPRFRVTHLEDGPPPCSPKSMYRLADLVDDKDLKAKALAAIKERMTEVNILDEMFSVFTSKSVTPHTLGRSLTSMNRYPDVREVQLDVYMKHRASPGVKTAFLRSISKFSSMPHAEPVLSAFYDRIAA